MTRLTTVLMLTALVAACSPDPVNESHSGALEEGDSIHPNDESFYDEYKFKAKEGWAIKITMNSTELDSYLQLRREGVDDAEFLQENDDVSSGNLNAAIEITAPATGTYAVWANSVEKGDTGPYTLTISAQPAE